MRLRVGHEEYQALLLGWQTWTLVPAEAFDKDGSLRGHINISSSRGESFTMVITDSKLYYSLLQLCDDQSIPMIAVMPNALSRRDMSHRCARRLARFKSTDSFSRFYALKLQHL